MARKKQRKPKLDPFIERDDASEKDLWDAFKMMLRDAPKRPRSENREPTKAEISQRWKLERK